MVNKYAEELEKEQKAMSASNPFNKLNEDKKQTPKTTQKIIVKKPHYEPKIKPNSYFNLILGSDYEALELDLRGLRYVSYMKGGKKVIELERKKDHYLSENGAEDILLELKGHLSTDIKLGFLTEKEFLKTQSIISHSLIKYMRNNVERLGMDTEEKQRKARPLIIMLLNRIRAVYSQSIQGTVNKSSHGDISLSGGLDAQRESRFELEEEKN